jgi:AcrR family transcriptional regulator
MPPTRGSKQQRGQERRQAILAAAVEEFATHGFRRRGLACLAERVGLTEAGLFYHFGSKNELIKAVLAERHTEGQARLERTLSQGGVARIEAIPVFMRSVLERPLLAKFAYVMLAESLDDDSPTHDYFEQRYRAVREDIGVWYREAAAELGVELDDETAVAYGQLTQAVMDGVQALWFLDPDNVDVGDLMTRFSAMMLHELECPDDTNNSCAAPEVPT